MADHGPQPTVTVQLVRAPDPSARRTTRIGIGLLVSLVGGWPALAAATSGEAFEAAIVRFLFTVALSVGGVLLVGSLWDRFTGEDTSDDAGPDTGDDPTDATIEATGLPVGKDQ